MGETYREDFDFVDSKGNGVSCRLWNLIPGILSLWYTCIACSKWSTIP